MGILRGSFIAVKYMKILLKLKSMLLAIRNLWENMQKVDNVVFFFSAKNGIKMLIISTLNRPEKTPSHENQRSMLITAITLNCMLELPLTWQIHADTVLACLVYIYMEGGSV